MGKDSRLREYRRMLQAAIDREVIKVDEAIELYRREKGKQPKGGDVE